MNEQHPGGPAGGPDYGSGSDSYPPNPFSRESAGTDSGLGSSPVSPSAEPTGIIGTPGGPPTDSYAPPAGAAGPVDPYAPPTGPQSIESSTPPSDPYQNPYEVGGAQPAYPTNPYQTNPYQTGGYNYGAPSPYGHFAQPHPKAVPALVLGIIGVAACSVAGVVGFVFGSKARREIDADPTRYSNRSTATAGWVLGIISIVFLVIQVLYILLVVGLGVGGYLDS